MTCIEVRERSFVDLDQATFGELAGDPGFWALVDAGVLTLGQPTATKVRLHATKYVGYAHVGGRTIQIVEKVPGSLEALISYASTGAFKLSTARGSASSLGDLIALLIGAFLERVRDYVARGVDFEYRRREEVGSLVGGPINVAKTVQLRAKGMRYSAAFFRPILRRDLPKNKVVLAALRQVELLARSVDVPSVDIATSRSLAHFFAESQDIEIVLGRREAWSAEARRLETEARGVADQDLLALAAVILSHESFEPEPLDSAQHVPRSWFVNLENLFERAARRALSRAILGRSQVTGPGSLHPPIFEGVTGRFRANPDFVVRTGAVAVAVGDAKYKTWRGLETKDIHGDLYQLLVHSAAHGSPVAFLLFAHNEFAVRHLGRSGTGADTWAFALDVRALDRDLSAALDLLGL